MRHSNNKLADIIFDIANAKYPAYTRAERVDSIETLILDHQKDIFSMVENIKETSLNGSDAARRYIDAEKKFGVPFRLFITL
jgi:hypothetical protein